MPSARSRAVTSADEPAGKRTVISIAPLCGYGGSWAPLGSAVPSNRPAAINARVFVQPFIGVSSTSGQNLGDRDPAPFARGLDAGADHGERGRPALAVHLGLRPTADRGGELVELVDDRVDLPALDRVRALGAALHEPQSVVQIVVR